MWIVLLSALYLLYVLNVTFSSILLLLHSLPIKSIYTDELNKYSIQILLVMMQQLNKQFFPIPMDFS